jgi:hypothetical protein
MEDEEIRILVARLARSHSSGGEVIERAAIMAEGTNSAAILEWIVAHDGQPEMVAPAASSRGLHSARLSAASSAHDSKPRRYVLPPGALS